MKFQTFWQMPRRRQEEIVRFGIVGAVCTILDIALYYFMREIVGVRIALILGYGVSLILNYILTVHWTFRKVVTWSNAIGFALAHLINLFIVRMGILLFFAHFIGLSDKVAYIPALLISIVSNFLVLRYIISKF